MQTKDIIEKVRKLLALSNSSNPNEAAAAAGAANKLIDQHRLSVADFEEHGGTTEALEEDEGFIYESRKVTNWKRTLVMYLAKHYGLSVLNQQRYVGDAKESRFRLIGRRSDIEIARYMYAWLSVECQRIARENSQGRGRIWVASYCEGFVSGVNDQLRASRQEVAKSVSTEAMVRVDSRGEESKAFMNRLYPNLQTSNLKTSIRYDPNAYHDGQAKGKSVHLGKSIGSSSSKKLLK